MDQTRETRTLPRVARVIVLTILMGMFLEMIPALLSAGVCTSRFIPKTPLIIWFAVVVYASVRSLAFLEVGIGRFLMARIHNRFSVCGAILVESGTLREARHAVLRHRDDHRRRWP